MSKKQIIQTLRSGRKTINDKPFHWDFQLIDGVYTVCIYPLTIKTETSEKTEQRLIKEVEQFLRPKRTEKDTDQSYNEKVLELKKAGEDAERKWNKEYPDQDFPHLDASLYKLPKEKTFETEIVHKESETVKPVIIEVETQSEKKGKVHKVPMYFRMLPKQVNEFVTKYIENELT